jgi:hypothetical protein
MPRVQHYWPKWIAHLRSRLKTTFQQEPPPQPFFFHPCESLKRLRSQVSGLRDHSEIKPPEKGKKDMSSKISIIGM